MHELTVRLSPTGFFRINTAVHGGALLPLCALHVVAFCWLALKASLEPGQENDALRRPFSG